MREALHLVVVEAAQQHAVDFERGEAGGARGANAAQHGVEAARDAGDALEGGRVYGVHAHRDAVESRGFERSGQRVEQMAVGGEGKIERLAPGGAHAARAR